MNIEHNSFKFDLQSAIVKDNFGVISGYACTYGKITHNDNFMEVGVFDKSVEEYKRLGRNIRMYFQHSETELIGGFPPAEIKIDQKGLYMTGYINLDVQRGKEAYALAKQGVLTDLSIGFFVEDYVIENGLRIIKNLRLQEVSLVSQPADTNANITDIQGATSFQDLPLTDRDREWDNDEAIARIRKFTGSGDDPSSSYRKAFMWFDADDADDYEAYKLPYADVINGRLKAVPRAIFAIAAALRGARARLKIPEADKAKVRNHVNRYYAKMGEESPLKSSSQNLTIDDILWNDFFTTKFFVNLLGVNSQSRETRKSFERELRNAGLSNEAASFLVSIYRQGKPADCHGQAIYDQQTIKHILAIVECVKAIYGAPS